MPLRKLFAAVPGVLQRLKPCIMMSPLSVSTFLQAEELKFDLIIFDEASQVFPWDAIGAIYRGTQLIVAGDDKQLPPTSFFSRADIEAEEEDEDIGDFESILSLCKSVNMPNKRLRWHYRSRREPLIAFSNRHFYDGDLVTFPSILDATRNAVQLIHVAEGRWIDRKNLAEARKVADLVVTHYKATPEKSLGVIAFNISQQQAIEDALYDLRRASPEIDAIFSTGSNEPLFIKNLENVQGDERDVILLSFGYGKNEAGKFIKNFGPLSKPGGERRLNVAVTRAREAVCLVASVRSADMDLSGSTSIGASLLKSYLEYAELGVDSLGRIIVETQGDCESPFEEEVAAALIRYGLEPVPQVGCGGFRIDLALKHPSNPGIYCLGIECDGATYHSSKTARDRDRIRQNVLEGLGWRICRVWSTDWVRNPQLQIQRILAAYQQASTDTPESTLAANKQPEAEFEDLQPEYVAEANVIAPTYLKIDDVPMDHITETAVRIVTRVGTIDWSELITLTSRELGFARTGKRIRDRIEWVLSEQVRQSILHRNGDRVSLADGQTRL
jgi:very-short-patch-repair endonuclease